ncbi:MAG TPA: AbrB/MazE/SpoVT family DNA-binding domain-containing protein [Acidobacteriota bacterium]
MAAVKVGTSRQVVIPKQLFSELGLSPGDYVEIEREKDRLVLTPKTLIDKRLAEALDDLRHGRVSRSFHSAEELIADLHRKRAQQRARKKTSKRRS